MTAAADKLIRVGTGPDAFLIHIEFQSTHDARFAARALLYNALARFRHGLPVRTVVILYRPEAAPGVTGQLVEGGWLRLEYTVVRLWEVPAERLLTGSLATVPFAPVAAVPPGQLAVVLDRAKSRFLAEVSKDQAARFGSMTELLLGLYFDEEKARELMGTFAETLEDSSVYKALIRRGKAEGVVEGEQNALLRMATGKLGTPPASAVARVRATADLDALGQLMGRLWAATTWDELLAGD